MFLDDPNNHGLRHNPFKALIAPRPIAWVSSMSPDGALNLAPFSYFNAVADRPPMIMFCPTSPRPNGGPKDTLVNIEATNEFVVNLVSWELREAMVLTSAHLAPEVDEFAVAGLTPTACRRVRVPRVAEALVSLECVFHHRVRLPSTDPAVENNVVFGRVVGIHIADALIVDGMIDMGRYRPVARLGYKDYTVVDTVFSIPWPDDDLPAVPRQDR